MSRPEIGRTASTNLTGGAGYRLLEGKIAVVTGASRGIGAAICDNLARKGCSLVMNYTSDKSTVRTQELAARLESTHSVSTVIVQADMGSLNGPAHIIATAKNHFAHPKTGKFVIDIVINNAGISVNQSIENVTMESYTSQYDINVRGPLLLMQAALPYLPIDRSGRIVNLSSVSSSAGFIGQSVYGGTKAALEAMTRTWARELAERATVNAVNPGPVATDMYGGTSPEFQERMNPFLRTTPLARARAGIDDEKFIEEEKVTGGRPAYEWEIAGVVGMLCTPESGWCTGSVICANGGLKFSIA